MRDAFGGAFMIKLFLVFIIIYVGFTAIALNYAKAFKVKNKVIDYLESHEIMSKNELPASIHAEMDEYFEKEILGTMNYRQDAPICSNDDLYCQNGIRIEKGIKSENTEGVYYKVSTYFGWEIPFINKLLALDNKEKNAKTGNGTWTISGETRVIVKE